MTVIWFILLIFLFKVMISCDNVVDILISGACFAIALIIGCQMGFI